MLISTNLFDKISEEEKNKIKTEASAFFGECKIESYPKDELDAVGVVKWIFTKVNLKSLTKDPIAWDGLRDLLLNLIVLTKSKSSSYELQFLIRDESNLAHINILFGGYDSPKLSEVFVLLREKLETEVFNTNKENESGKSILVGLDEEKNNWRVQVL